MSAEPPAFPKALDDDDDDVAWALQTAHARWERGGHADAVVWLRRAAQSALELERVRARGRSREERSPDRPLGAAQRVERARAAARKTTASTRSSRATCRCSRRVRSTGRRRASSTPSKPKRAASRRTGPSPEEIDEVEGARGRRDHRRAARVRDARDPEETRRRCRAFRSTPFRLRLPRKFPTSMTFPTTELEEPTQAIEASRGLGFGRGKAVEEIPEKPPSAPLVAVEPEPMPPVPAARVGAPAATCGRSSASRSTTRRRHAATSRRPRTRPNPRSIPRSPTTRSSCPTRPNRVRPGCKRAHRPSSRRAEEPPGPGDRSRAHRIGAWARRFDARDPRRARAARARTRTLEPDEEVGGYGLLWVMKGTVLVMPTIADAVVGWAMRRANGFFARQPRGERGAARGGGSRRAPRSPSGSPSTSKKSSRSARGLPTSSGAIADRFQALAGAATGLLGERLDDSMRAMVTDRSEVKLLLGGEVVFEQGKPVVGLYVVGAGELELVRDGKLERKLGPGDLLFPSAVSHARAGAGSRARRSARGARALLRSHDHPRARRQRAAAARARRDGVSSAKTAGRLAAFRSPRSTSSLPWGPAKRRPNQRASVGIVSRPSARTRGNVSRKALRHGCRVREVGELDRVRAS